jgi:hypothetical protein
MVGRGAVSDFRCGGTHLLFFGTEAEREQEGEGREGKREDGETEEKHGGRPEVRSFEVKTKPAAHACDLTYTPSTTSPG